MTLIEKIEGGVVLALMASAAIWSISMVNQHNADVATKAKLANDLASAQSSLATVEQSHQLEQGLINATERLRASVVSATSALNAVPVPPESPACDYTPLVSAWRGELDRMRTQTAPSSPVDDSADGASVVPSAGPGGSH